jgi:HK97 family phage major capsid protein
MDKTIPKKQFRKYESVKFHYDEENEEIEFSFSSEEPYERYFGYEIISHDTGDMDLARLNSKAQLLFNHNPDVYLGVISKAWIDGKKGKVRTRFSKEEFQQSKLRDIKDEILSNVSFGYMITDVKPVEKINNIDAYRVKTMPFEVSIVTIPADYTVGINRSIEGEGDISLPFSQTQESNKNAESDPSKSKEQEKAKTLAAEAAQQERIRMQETSEAVKAVKETNSAIIALGQKHGMTDLAMQLVAAGKNLEEAKDAFMERMGKQQKPVTGNEAIVGLTEREMKQYSIMRAIRAMMDPNNKKFQEEAAFEREVSVAAAQKGGKEARGFMIPVDILRSPLFVEKRDLTVGSSTAGGNLVSTNLLSGSFIEILRKKSVLQRAGAQVLNGLVGNIAIPRQTGAATAYWVGEGSAPTESQQSFDQVTMSPKTLGAYVDYSRKLMLQGSIDVEAFIRNDLAIVAALEIDRVGLYGSGSSNQPLGIKDTSGINTVDFAGATPTYTEIVAMESAVAADDADIEGMKYLVNASMRGALKTAEKASGYPAYIWEPGNTVNGYNALVSNQIATGDIFHGNFNDMIMGFWSGLDLLVDPYTGSKEGNVRVVGHQDVDVCLRHVESVCRGNNTL